MELWGFENSRDLSSTGVALLQVAPGGTHQGNANATRDLPPAQDAEPIPANVEATPENVARLTDPTIERRVVFEFQGTRNQNGHLSPDPTQIWRIPAVFRHTPGSDPRIDSREEAQAILSSARENPNFQRLLEIDGNPTIRYLGPDGNDPDHNLDVIMVQGGYATLAGLEEHGRTAEEIRHGENSNNSESGVEGIDQNFGAVTLEQSKTESRRLERQVDSLLALLRILVMMNSDPDAMRSWMIAHTLKTGARVGRNNSMTIAALERLDRKYNDLQRRRETLLSGNTDAHTQGRLSHLDNEMRNIARMREALELFSRDDAARLREEQDDARDTVRQHEAQVARRS